MSVARRNRYGLPDAPVLDRWRAAGADVVQTWQKMQSSIVLPDS